MKKIFLAAVALVMMSCNVVAQDVDNEDYYNTLEYNTDNDILENNEELVRLIDPLYQYVNDKNFSSKGVEKNLRWMNKFRRELCKYYDKHELGGLSVDEYAKVDTIKALSQRVYGTSHFPYAVALANNVEHMFLVMQNYTLLSQLLNKCKTVQQKKLIKNEFKAWSKMEKVYTRICANLAQFPSWGGSMALETTSAASSTAVYAHIEMYKKQLACISNAKGSSKVKYVSLKSAKNELISSARLNLKKVAGNLDDSDYKKAISETRRYINQLGGLMDNWTLACQSWNKAIKPGNKLMGVALAEAVVDMKSGVVIEEY